MTSRKLVLSALVLALGISLWSSPAVADRSHARIIRVSYVQGDVRFLRESSGDPLADSKATWEKAALNLPIRQGNVLATDNGRAEVEFENGTTAFLKENTVIEFFDLTLQDGAHTTRLVLRQGTASFHTSLVGDDYFSVTGGDFTVEAERNSSFRIDSYDDGSTVETLKGNVSVLRKQASTRVAKGQSFSVKAGDESAAVTGAAPEQDDFDRWVSERVESETTATTSTLQYTSSPYYAAGFGTLSSYGAWSSCGSFGFGWRPFGAGLGWSPFSNGQWFWDPSYGWTFMSAQPWGWAPYHYGGWMFEASCGGWFYSPPVYFNNPPYMYGPRKRGPLPIHAPRPVYKPATAVFVKQGGKVGIVPMHPSDNPGKTPKNLERGVFALSSIGAEKANLISSDPGKKWGALKSAPRTAMESALTRVDPPVRFSRSIVESKVGATGNSLGKDSSIAYDAKDHRYVNSNSGPTQGSVQEKISGVDKPAVKSGQSTTGSASVTSVQPTDGAKPTVVTAGEKRTTTPPPSVTNHAAPTPPPARPIATPPPAPRTSGGSGSRSSGGGWGGSSSGGSSSGRSSSAGATGSPSHSSGGASHPSSGKPH
jgi:hypothetical protein